MVDGKEMVNHPSHYMKNGVECIDVIKAMLGKDGFKNFCKGNAIKYIWREDEKNGDEDLKKARMYIDYMLEK